MAADGHSGQFARMLTWAAVVAVFLLDEHRQRGQRDGIGVGLPGLAALSWQR